MRCRYCGRNTHVGDEDTTVSVLCGGCVVLEQNFLENRVLNPESCTDMRNERNLSELQLAKATGTTERAIKNWEAGKAKGCPPELVKELYSWYIGRKR